MDELVKLDLILDRSKRNLSETETFKAEWFEICKKVAQNNPDIRCPLFMTYVDYLKEEGLIIQYDVNGRHNATIKGLLFEGFVNRQTRLTEEKNHLLEIEQKQIEIQENIKNLQNRTVKLTRWLSVWTLIAAIYYLIEIGKFFTLWK
ncbi:MAG TPA: hypothetical protein VN698_06635 [Bacteroidia bacterium]|nr:hypothetical protein [Bacteroidia bacterium]